MKYNTLLGIKSVMLLVMVVIIICGGKSSASEKCVTAEPNSESDVLNCLSSASMHSSNNTNPFTANDIEKTQCLNVRMIYAQVLGAHGVSKDKIVEKLPNCETLAVAITKLNGIPPIWNDCLGYDATPEHMISCLSAMISGAFAKPSILENCMVALMTYETMLSSLSKNFQRFEKPKNYEAIDCDRYLDELIKSKGLKTKNPCAGFDAKNLREHALKCLQSDSEIIRASAVLNCDSLSRLYKAKLAQVYGNVPNGFRVPSCTIMEDIRLQLVTSSNDG